MPYGTNVKMQSSRLVFTFSICASFFIISDARVPSNQISAFGNAEVENEFVEQLEKNVKGIAETLPKLEFRRYITHDPMLSVKRRSVNSTEMRTWINVSTSHTVITHHTEEIKIQVLRDKPKRIKYKPESQYTQVISDDLLPNLRTAARFRDNVVFIFGYILQSPRSNLTEDQRLSLEIIFDAIRKKQVHFYKLLPTMSKIYKKSKKEQFENVMTSLLDIMPVYWKCSVQFWVEEIKNQRFVPKNALAESHEKLNFLSGINKNFIDNGATLNPSDEMEGYDENSKITQAVLGSVFVKIFKNLRENALFISAPLFSTILFNLPNPDGDPVFEEYVRFVAEIAWNRDIPNWHLMKNCTDIEEPFSLIRAMTDRICKNTEVSLKIKEAMMYIRDQFIETENHILHQAIQPTHLVIQGGLNIRLLLSLISPGYFTPSALKLQSILIRYTYSNSDDVQKALSGMNQFGYRNPKELLLAFLSRLRTRLPVEHREIRKAVTGLLSLMLLKRQDWKISLPTPTPGVSLWTLFEAIDDSQLNAETSRIIRLILNDLLKDLEIWDKINAITFPDKEHCTTPEICLGRMLKKIVTMMPKGSLSKVTIKRIIKLLLIIREKTEYSECVEHQDNPLCVGYIDDFYKDYQMVSDLNGTVTFGEEFPSLPVQINPEKRLEITVPESGSPFIANIKHIHNGTRPPNTVTLPSVICQQNTAKMDAFGSDCEKVIELSIRQPLITILGANYTEILLGNDWDRRYKTRVSFIFDLIDNAAKNPKVMANKELIQVVVRYQRALKYIASYILLPLIASFQKIETVVVWSTYHTVYSLGSSISSNYPETVDSDAITLPLIHPRIWLTPVDLNNTFGFYLPNLSVNDPYAVKIEPLVTLLKSQTIYDYLGKDWNPSQYPTSGAHFTAVLHKLLKSEKIRQNIRLYQIVQSYLKVIELTPIYVRITRDYIREMVQQYRIRWGIHKLDQYTPVEPFTPIEQFSDLDVKISAEESTVAFYSSINPEQDILLTSLESGSLIVKSLDTDKAESISKNDLILPSLVCLEGVPTGKNENDGCEQVFQFNIIEPLIKRFGVNYVKIFLGDNWKVHSPTRISFLYYLFDEIVKKEKAIDNVNLIATVKRYKRAIEFTAPYIQMPLIASSKQLDTLVVWTKLNTENCTESVILADQPEASSSSEVIIPMINPRTWMLPVDINKPFYKFLPNLPVHNSHASFIQPLVDLIKTNQILRFLGNNWNPSQYPNRGALYLSVLDTMMQSEEIKSNEDLRNIVQIYLLGMQMTSLCSTIPQEFIDKIVKEYKSTSVTHERTETIVEPNYEETVSDLDIRIQVNEETQTFLQSIDTENNIQVIVPNLDEPITQYSTFPEMPETENMLLLPSVVCLEGAPKRHEFEDGCEKTLRVDIQEPLIKLFGENYIQEILGNDWINRYPTRIAFLLDLIEKSLQNPKLDNYHGLNMVFQRYRLALKFIATNIMLRIIADKEKFDTLVIWAMYNSENRSQSKFQIAPPTEINEHAITLPLMNPKIWGMPVDLENPFWKLLPTLPDDNPYSAKLKPLRVLFNTGKIRQLLGKEWNPRMYANRGDLFVSVLRILLKEKTVQSNIELYTLVQNYLNALQIPSIFSHVSRTYIKEVVNEYHEESVIYQQPGQPVTEPSIEIVEPFSDLNVKVVTDEEATVLPPQVNPENVIKVTVPEKGPLVAESLVLEKNETSPNTVVVPSVVCLERKPSSDNSEDNCGEDLETNIMQPLIKIFGQNVIEVILGPDWTERYPTKASLLIDLLRNVANNTLVTRDKQLSQKIKTYSRTLKFAAPYLLLPMISTVKKLDSLVVWSKYSSTNYSESQITSNPPEGFVAEKDTMPLVNPKFWLMSVDLKKPFSKLIPHLPEDNPYGIKLKPLTDLFKTEKVREYLDENWNPSQYENRGALFMSVLHTLLKSKKIESDLNLKQLVKEYLQNIEMTSVSARVPHTYVEKVVEEYRHISTTYEYNKTIIQTTHKEQISDLNEKIDMNEKPPVLLQSINPANNIHVVIPDSNQPIVEYSTSTVNISSTNTVTLPSVFCLESAPRAYDDEDDCEKVFRSDIIQPLTKVYGENYIQKILGDDWIQRYPTRMSFLLDLFKKSVESPKIVGNKQFLTIINKYKTALKFVATDIFVPMIADTEKFDSLVVWSTYNRKNPSESKFETAPPEEIDGNSVTLPMVNPKVWGMPVDHQNPFWKLLPNLPENNPYAVKLKPLTLLFNTGKVRELLGQEWNPSQYPNRGTLFVSVLRKLLDVETVRSNEKLYTLVQNYLKTLEVPSLYSHISRTNIKKVVKEYHNVSVIHEPVPTTTELPIEIKEPFSDLDVMIVTNDNDSVLPSAVNPEEFIEVTVPQAGPPKVESLIIETNVSSPDAVVIPSMVCLEHKPSLNGFNEVCGEDLKLNIIQPLIKIYGKEFQEVILGKDWKSRYPTTASYLTDVLHKIANDSRVISDQHLFNNVRRYTQAMEYGVPYTVLPMIAAYQNLESLVVWASYSPKNYTETYIGSNPPEDKNLDVVTMPLMNPKFWLIPVDVKNPFYKLLPHLPEDNPHAIKLKPLTELFKTGKVREYLGKDWNPSQYENRGALFISVLHTISKSEKIQSNVVLKQLVKDYLKTIEVTSFSSKVPHSYVQRVVEEYRNVSETHVFNKTTTVSHVEMISDLNVKIVINKTQIPVLQEPVNPKVSMLVTMSDSHEPIVEYLTLGEKHPSANSVILPSINCLETAPSIHDFNDECESYLRKKIYQPILKILGENCIEELLGHDWVHRYPTRISFLTELVDNLVENPKITVNRELFILIKQYQVALEFVATDILLPIVSDKENLDTFVVWSSYNTQNHSESKLETGQPKEVNEHTITLPLVNPKIWGMPVDLKNPFWKLLPNLPEDNPYAIKLKPLTVLFKTGKIREMLGKDWNASQYRNRGSLFVSVLHKLLERETIKSDVKLYTLIHDYLKAVEIPSQTHISKTHIKTVVEEYHNITVIHESVPTTTEQPTMKIMTPFSDLDVTIAIDEHAPIFPPFIYPEENIELIVSDYGVPIAESLISVKNYSSHDLVIIPSVACLESPPLIDDSNDDCEEIFQPNIRHLLVKVFGYNFTEVILGSYWRSKYSTRMSAISILLDNVVPHSQAKNDVQLMKLLKKYREGLKYIVPYVFLPMLTAYKEINTLVVWTSYYLSDFSQSYIGSKAPKREESYSVTIPLVNPRLWANPVNLKHPFAKLLPHLLEDNPYAIKLKPLTELFKSKKIYNYLGPNWSPSKYINRGDLLISVLRILLNSESVKLDTNLYSIVQDYWNAIEVTAFYINIPKDYVTKAIKSYTPPKPKIQVQITTFSELDVKLVIHENAALIPPFIDPEKRIVVSVSGKLHEVIGFPTSLENTISSNAVILPSLIYLAGKPNFDNPHADCDKTLQVQILKPLAKIFGQSYTEAILGNDWSVRYHTKLSVLYGLLRVAEEHPKVATNRFLLKVVKKYMVAIRFVAPYVFLPIISNYKKLDSLVIWATYYSTNPLHSEIANLPKNLKSSEGLTLPMMNPSTWFYPVDPNNPFSKLIPTMPVEHSYFQKLQPLSDLFKSGNVTKLLGKDWNHTQYPNKGALFLSVMNKLLESKVVQSNAALHQLVKNYAKLMEWTSTNIYLPSSVMEKIVTNFHLTWDDYESSQYVKGSNSRILTDIIKDPNASVLPPTINPDHNIKVTIPENGSSIVESSTSVAVSCSSNVVTLPSIICLEDPPSIEDSGDLCDKILEPCVTEPLINIFGDNYIEEILNQGWRIRYVARIAFLYDLLKSAAAYPEVEMDDEVSENLKRHIMALELVGSYILLPIVADYRKLTSHVVWSTLYPKDRSLSNIKSTPPWGVSSDLTTLPLVNPKTWFLPLDSQNPLSNLIPTFPANNPFTLALDPLTKLLNRENIHKFLGPNWDPKQYQNRGAILVSVLRSLLELERVKSDYQLYRLVQNYLNAIVFPSLYVHVPSSYIKSISHRSTGFWSIDLVDLLMALPTPQTNKEQKFWNALHYWLSQADLLEKLGIKLPAMTTSRSTFLSNIITKALSSSAKVELVTDVESALKYYKDKVQQKGFGAKYVVWLWSRGWIEKTTVNLGNILTSIINLKTLPLEQQHLYQSLMEYLQKNPKILAIQEFPIDEYKTIGEFLKAYLKHLENQKDFDPKYKKHIESIIPFISLNGPGKVSMPNPIREQLQ